VSHERVVAAITSPDDWRQVRLKDIAEFNLRKLSEDADPRQEIKYTDISAVAAEGSRTEPVVVPFSQAPSRARRLADVGDTLVSTVRPYLRAITMADRGDLVWSTGFAVLHPRPRVDARYLYYHCCSEPVIQELVSRSVGVSFPAISPDTLAATRVVIPPQFIQCAIGDFLDRETERIDALIEKKQRLLSSLEERDHAMLDEVVGSAKPVRRLGHFLARIEQGWSPECESRPALLGEWGVLKTGAANGGRYRPSENKALPSDVLPRTELEVRAGDVLMSRANTRALIGAAAYVEMTRERLLLCDKLYRLRPFREKLDARYLALILRSSAARARIESETVGASDSMQNISQELVRDLLLPLPEIEIQQGILRNYERQRTMTARYGEVVRRQVSLLHERRHALITEVVTGQRHIDARPPVAA